MTRKATTRLPRFAYAWTPPAFRVDQRVRFEWQHGVYRIGSVTEVTTHYDAEGAAVHLYRCVPDGLTAARYVGHGKIWHRP